MPAESRGASFIINIVDDKDDDDCLGFFVHLQLQYKADKKIIAILKRRCSRLRILTSKIDL